MLCQHDGCGRPARFAPRICVPPTGWPVTANKNLKAVFGLALCREHFLDTKPEQFFGEKTYEADGSHKLRGVFEWMVKAAGSSVPPDFTRAFIEACPIDSDEFRALSSARASK